MEGDAAPAPELRPLGVGEILDVSIKIYLRHFRTLLAIVALVVVPIQLLLVPLLASALPDTEALRPQGGAAPPPTADPFAAEDLGVLLAANGIAVIVSFIGVTLAQAAAFKAISDAYLGRRPDWRSSLRLAGRLLPAALWISVLVGVLASLALLLFILPAIWLGIAWSVVIPVLMVEGIRGRRALDRSFRLVRGRWWPTFAVVMLGFVLAAVVQAVVVGLLSLVLFTGAGDSPFASVLVSQLGTAIGASLATPFQAAIVAIVYFDLRVRKEGFDLQLLAERVGVDPGAAAQSASADSG